VGRLTQIGMPSSRQGDALHGKPGNTPRHIIRLQFFTLAWMLVECGVALFSAWKAHSPALLAFGSDSFVEVLSAVVVLLQFAPSFTLAPGRAARVSGILLFVLAGVVALSSFGALMQGVHPDSSWGGIAVTIAALAVMPVLARAKRVAGEKMENRALMADAVQSATCAYLAAVTLSGLLINALFHVRWVDPIAALVAIPIICIEGARTARRCLRLLSVTGFRCAGLSRSLPQARPLFAHYD
jgi:divalent metal cation (Fe/Co/Zn/Cd) transporter